MGLNKPSLKMELFIPYHHGFTVATKSVFQKFCQNWISEWNCKIENKYLLGTENKILVDDKNV